jgi:hypothetical protein
MYPHSAMWVPHDCTASTTQRLLETHLGSFKDLVQHIYCLAPLAQSHLETRFSNIVCSFAYVCSLPSPDWVAVLMAV